jgi:hypothetical protein
VGNLSPKQARFFYEVDQRERAAEKILEAQVILTSTAAAHWGGKSANAFNQMISEFRRIALGSESKSSDSKNERATLQSLKVIINGKTR